MTNVFSRSYWQEEFDITTNDLGRISKWMREKQIAFTLSDLVQRLIRGRLEHGEDISTAALPEWVREEKVLSWDAEEQWELGSRVLVARLTDKEIKPFLGVIVDTSSDVFFIRLEGGEEIVKYGRTKSTGETERRFEAIRRAIAKKGRAARQDQIHREADENVEIILLEHGTRVASRLLTSLSDDSRFVSVGDRWFLEELLVPLSQNQLNNLYQKMLAEGEILTLEQMLPSVDPSLPPGDIGLFSLQKALEEEQRGLFEQSFTEGRSTWRAVKPPPPPWEEAIAAYYIYDPSTYEVILQPGQPLKKYIAERLQELGLYDQVVIARVS